MKIDSDIKVMRSDAFDRLLKIQCNSLKILTVKICHTEVKVRIHHVSKSQPEDIISDRFLKTGMVPGMVLLCRLPYLPVDVCRGRVKIRRCLSFGCPVP